MVVVVVVVTVAVAVADEDHYGHDHVYDLLRLPRDYCLRACLAQAARLA